MDSKAKLCRHLFIHWLREIHQTMTTLSSREFNKHTSRAKKAAADGPFFITERGKPAHVLLSIDEYQRIAGQRRNIVEALSMPGLSDIEVGFPRARERARPTDLS
jgi:prevent-host-death family protein